MYNKKAHIHFIGIGGIGMSGIATILKQQGYTISGCDLDLNQKSVRSLAALGCTMHHGNNLPACADPSIDVLVYSSAIEPNNPEILTAQRKGIPTISRAFMLAELMRTKFSVAIAGSHGKTTTTSLISHILMEASLDPTVIIGGHVATLSTNARLGTGEFLVAEADESDRSLVHLKSTFAVVTNIDLEHLETYKNLDDIKQTFQRFLANLPFYGKAIVNADDPNIQSILPISHVKTVGYGLTSHADWYADDILLNPSTTTFTLHSRKLDQPYAHVQLGIPGIYNLQNALAATALAHELGVPIEKITAALERFAGVERRFSYLGNYKGAELFDDYGHHPNEITQVLTVAKKRAHANVTAVFQPHRFTRTEQLWDEFIQTFLHSQIDHLIITDIYAASEAPIPGVTSKQMVDAIRAHKPHFTVEYVAYDSEFTEICNSVALRARPKDLILFLGAGKLNRVPEYLP